MTALFHIGYWFYFNILMQWNLRITSMQKLLTWSCLWKHFTVTATDTAEKTRQLLKLSSVLYINSNLNLYFSFIGLNSQSYFSLPTVWPLGKFFQTTAPKWKLASLWFLFCTGHRSVPSAHTFSSFDDNFLYILFVTVSGLHAILWRPPKYPQRDSNCRAHFVGTESFQTAWRFDGHFQGALLCFSKLARQENRSEIQSRDAGLIGIRDRLPQWLASNG